MRAQRGRRRGPDATLLLLVTAALVLLPDARSQSIDNITLLTTEPEIRAALLKQRDALTNWERFSQTNSIQGWNLTAPICNWTGIFCPLGPDPLQGFEMWVSCYSDSSSGRADVDPDNNPEAFAMCQTAAEGSLVDDLAAIQPLNLVDFTNQRLSGTLPKAWGASGAFPLLYTLTLQQGGSTALTGPLPDEWSNPAAWASLTTLTLGQNKFTGSLPASWGNLDAFPQLQYFTLKDALINSEKRAVPLSWATGFPKLRLLDLSGNRLLGPLPKEWSFIELETLNLQGNFFAGTLQEVWGDSSSLEALETLNLSDNVLVGTLPEEWGNDGILAQLTSIDLSNNKLTGSIPPSWNASEALQSLQYLNVSGNRMCGPLPENWLTQVCGPEDPTNKCLKNCASPPPQPASRLPPPPPKAQSSSSSSSTAAIVGGVVGGTVGLALASALAFLALRHRKRRRRQASGPRSLESAYLAATGGGAKGPPPHAPQDSATDPPGGRPPGDGAPANGRRPLSASNSPARDPVLLYISSRLPSMRQLAAAGSRLAERGSGSVGRDASWGLSSGLAATAGMPSGTSVSRSDPSSLTVSPRARSTLPADVQQWEVRWEDMQLQRLVGKGSYGRVYEALWHETPVACKLLLTVDECNDESFILPEAVLRELQAEAAILVRMRHPNVVTFLGLCPLPPCLVTEYCSRGSLFDVLRNGLRDPACAAELTWALRLQLALDAARGLLYLHMHQPPIIHRDVKSPNLLITEHWHVKVADFNLSKILHPQAGNATQSSIATNPIWQAPEVMSGERPTAASDTYAFGLVMFELLTWTLPWGAGEDMLPFQVCYKVLQGERPEVPPLDELPGPDKEAQAAGLEAYCALMRHCWAEEPGQRPGFGEVAQRLKALLEQAGGRARSSGAVAGGSSGGAAAVATPDGNGDAA